MIRIQKMSTLLANQIAAGEVIERPAQVVKELIENSIDAGATEIHIHILSGGMQSIRVSDNGHGVVQDDLLLAVTAHATSKMCRVEDLENIISFGFRGEALACIAAVAELTFVSKPVAQEHAFALISSPSTPAVMKPMAHPDGTTVTVNHLFRNTPARLKFLRSEATEFDHIAQVVRSAALSRFDIEFHLTHQQKSIYQFPKAQTPLLRETRLKKILGATFVASSLLISAEGESLALNGWIAKPVYTRLQNDAQYCYVNGRIVRDRLLSHAIRRAYDDLLPPGRHPSYVLFFSCDPAVVDVNVHPTKHEVRFRQARWVHDFITHAVKQALSDGPFAFMKEPSPTTCATEPPMFTAAKPALPQSNYPVILAWLTKQDCMLQQNDEMLIINVRAVWQNDRLQAFLAADKNRSVQAKLQLIPLRCLLSKSTMNWIQSEFNPLKMLGFEWSALSEESLVIRAIPSFFLGVNFAEALPACAEAKTATLQDLAALLLQYLELSLDDYAIATWWRKFEELKTQEARFRFLRTHVLKDWLP